MNRDCGRVRELPAVEAVERRLCLASSIVVLVEPPTSTPYFQEYSATGERGYSFRLPSLAGGLNVGQVEVGDFSVGSDKSIDIPVGTSSPKLLTHAGTGWAINPGFEVPFGVEKGVLARIGNDVFLDTGSQLVRQTSDGVRTSFATGTYSDLSAGLDGKLYALRNDGVTVEVFNATTLSKLRQFVLSQSVNAIAVDATGTVFAGASGFFRFNSVGVLQQEHDLTQDFVTDIEVDSDGTIIAGTANRRWLKTDSNFSDVDAFYPLESTAEVRGVAFGTLPNPNQTQRFSFSARRDDNYDGQIGTDDGYLSDVEVYLDLNNDGVRSWREPNSFSSANGSAGFYPIALGSYQVRAIAPSGSTLVLPTNNGSLSSAAQGGFLFASQSTGSVSGSFFNDTDGDGTRDSGEVGLNVPLTFSAFLDLNGNAIQDSGDRSTSVKSDGSYFFANVAPGTYKLYPIKADNSSGSKWSASSVAPMTVTVQPGQVNAGPNVGYQEMHKFTVQVLADYDKDGQVDTGERGLSGYSLFVDLNANKKWDTGEPLDYTDSNGEATFTMPAGSYPVYISNLVSTLSVITGRSSSPPDPMSNHAWEKDGIAVIPDFASPIHRLTFHVSPPGKIEGTVFIDVDGDGVRDVGEEPYNGFRVYMDANNNRVFDEGEQYRTNYSKYTFSWVSDGTYTLRLSLSGGWRQTFPTANGSHVVTISRSGQLEIRDFGVQLVNEGSSISGTVWNDVDGDGIRDTGEPPLPNVLVFDDVNNNGQLDPGLDVSVLSGSGGDYKLTGLQKGTHYLRQQALDGYTRTAPAGNVHTIALPSSANFTGYNFAQRQVAPPPPTTGSISGVTFDDSNKNGLLDTGETKTSSKTVFLDSNNNGKLDSGEKSTKTSTTGAYSFTNLTAGTYYVRRVFPSGYTYSNLPLNLVLAGGQDITNANIGSVPVGTPPPPPPPPPGQTGSISGFTFDDKNKNGLLDSGESKTSGKTVFLDSNNNGKLDSGEKSTKTNTSGAYSFTGLVAGTYYVRRVFPSGYTYSNLPLNLALAAGQSITNANIGSIVGTVTPPPPPPPSGDPKTASISGFLFWDNDRDGKFDTGESYQASKTVFIDLDDDNVLDSNEKKLTTDSKGAFKFTGLAAGTYVIKRIVPSGYKITTPKAVVTLSAGQVFSGVAIGTNT